MRPPSEAPKTHTSDTELEELRAEVSRLRAELKKSRALEERAAVGPECSFREVLDSFPEQVAVFDRDLRFIYVNASSVADDELRQWVIGRTDEQYCQRRGRSPETSKQRKYWQQRAIETRSSVSFEEEVEGPDGEKRHYLRIFNPVFSPPVSPSPAPSPPMASPAADVRTPAQDPAAQGELRWLLGYGFEITENRMLKEQLRQTQKLEAVGQLVSGVAHDFNNLLTALQGYSDLLLRSLSPDDRQFMLASEIRKVGDKAGALTRQLLTYSRRRRRKPDDLDLNELVRDSFFLLERTLGEWIRVEIRLIEGNLGISIDAGQLQQVLLNLALNARDAMPEGGILKLETDREPWVEREGQRLRGPWAVLRVEDDGTGIAAELQQKIFEPFFTTKAEDKGTGLGLSTVSGIARQNAGFVRLSSEIGKGSRFEVVFPEVDLSSRQRAAAAEAEQDRQGDDGMETLLLVEDEDSVRELTAGFLRHLGYTVLEARDGLEALTISEEHTGRLDLILSDVVMPRMGGPELARQLSPRRPHVRWVFMSGYPDRARMPEEVGAEAPFLEKPFRPSQLGRTIRKVLDRHLA